MSAYATVRAVIGARAVIALVLRREGEDRDPQRIGNSSLARVLLRAQSNDWPCMSAVLRACDPSMPETGRDTFALARDNMCSST